MRGKLVDPERDEEDGPTETKRLDEGESEGGSSSGVGTDLGELFFFLPRLRGLGAWKGDALEGDETAKAKGPGPDGDIEVVLLLKVTLGGPVMLVLPSGMLMLSSGGGGGMSGKEGIGGTETVSVGRGGEGSDGLGRSDLGVGRTEYEEFEEATGSFLFSSFSSSSNFGRALRLSTHSRGPFFFKASSASRSRSASWIALTELARSVSNSFMEDPAGGV